MHKCTTKVLNFIALCVLMEISGFRDESFETADSFDISRVQINIPARKQSRP